MIFRHPSIMLVLCLLMLLSSCRFIASLPLPGRTGLSSDTSAPQTEETEAGFRFRDVTLELGEVPELTPALFLEEDGPSENIRIVTDLSRIDLTVTGSHRISLSAPDGPHTVTLTVVDTTLPSVVFRDVTADVGYLFTPEDFIESMADASPLSVTAAMREEGLFFTEVTVTVSDTAGNTVEDVRTLTLNWLRPEVTLEFGQPLTEADLLIDPAYAAGTFDAGELSRIGAAVGTYTLTAEAGGLTQSTVVTVADTTPPALQLKSLRLFPGDPCRPEDFIETLSDASDISVSFGSPVSTAKTGTFTVTVAAVDAAGNRTEKQARLVVSVSDDETPPTFSGLTDLSVLRDETPDLREGVRAYDKVDGEISFRVDASQVDFGKSGTYFAIYTAKDAAGNTVTKKRKISVADHSAADTRALVAEMSAQIGTEFASRTEEALAVREFVRQIRYTTAWGDPDPTYYGFTYWKGNCKVHATCLKDILDLRGFETHLIWVNEKYTPHYWVQVKLDGVWWHIDATPVGTHNKAPVLMNDTERLYYLRENNYTTARLWDTELWPACTAESGSWQAS